MSSAIQLYEGNDPYIFCSFADEDQYIAVPLIESLANNGYRVWFDAEGDLPYETVASKLSNSRACLSLISKASANSHICRSIINCALEQEVLLIPVSTEAVALTPAVRLLLEEKQSVNAAEFSLQDPKDMEEFLKTILRPSECNLCRQAAYQNTPWLVTCVTAVPSAKKKPKGSIVPPEPGISGVTVHLEMNTLKEEEPSLPETPISEPDRVELSDAYETTEKAVDDRSVLKLVSNLEDLKTETLLPRQNKGRILIDLNQGKVIRLGSGVTRLGRSAINDICLAGRVISAKHAQLFANANGRLMVRDVGSTNGSYINGVRLHPTDPKEAGNFSIISFADQHFLYLNEESASDILKMGVVAYLTCEENGDIVGIHPNFVLGRDNPWPSGAFTENGVSHEHGVFCAEKEGYRFRVSRSTNGTTFNHTAITEGQTTDVLKNGDEINAAQIHRVVYHVVKLKEA